MVTAQHLAHIQCSVALASLVARAQDLTSQWKGQARQVEWIGAYAFEYAWPNCAQRRVFFNTRLGTRD